MTFNLDTLQRATLSLVGALFLATVFVGSAIVPSETTHVIAPVA